MFKATAIETLERAAERLRADLAPRGGLEDYFFQQIVRATVLIDCCERRLDQIEIESAEFPRLTRILMGHRRWLTASLKFLSQLQAQRAERHPGETPTRLAQIVTLKPKRAATSAPPPIEAEPAAGQDTPVPRSAPCPCGSGQKYKRCCGRNAPPVLGRAAA